MIHTNCFCYKFTRLYSSVEIPLSEGPVNLNWGPIMKTINESPYDFFQQGGWTFLSGTGGEDDSDADGSDTESEFAADTEELISSESSAEESAFDGSDASEDSGSGSSFDDESEGEIHLITKGVSKLLMFVGESWDELEKKAAKCQF